MVQHDVADVFLVQPGICDWSMGAANAALTIRVHHRSATTAVLTIREHHRSATTTTLVKEDRAPRLAKAVSALVFPSSGSFHLCLVGLKFDPSRSD